MNIRDFLPALAILAGVLSVVAFCTFDLGGYGLMLSASIGAGLLSGSTEPDPDNN